MNAPDEKSGGHRVLVLMATFNGATWLREQVCSIVAQQGVAVSLAVRDDASADRTLEALRDALGPNDGGLQLFRAASPGGSPAGNFFHLMQAVDAAGHDFVALADQDDIWDVRKLSRAVECLQRSGAAGYSAAVCAFWTDGRSEVLKQQPRETSADYLFEGAGQGCTFVLTSAFFHRVQLTLRANQILWNALHYHDWTLYALCRAHAEKWYFDDWVSMRYRQHAGNDTGARSGWFGIRKRMDLIRSGWYGKQVESVALLCVSVAGPSAVGAARFLQCMCENNWLLRRTKIAAFVLWHGRRRRLDRIVLAWAAAAGHLDPE